MVLIGSSSHHCSPTGRAPLHSSSKTSAWCFQAVVGSIVWAFGRLKKPMSREMSARGYVLTSFFHLPGMEGSTILASGLLEMNRVYLAILIYFAPLRFYIRYTSVYFVLLTDWFYQTKSVMRLLYSIGINPDRTNPQRSYEAIGFINRSPSCGLCIV